MPVPPSQTPGAGTSRTQYPRQGFYSDYSAGSHGGDALLPMVYAGTPTSPVATRRAIAGDAARRAMALAGEWRLPPLAHPHTSTHMPAFQFFLAPPGGTLTW